MPENQKKKPLIVARSGEDWAGRYGRRPQPRFRREAAASPRPPRPATQARP